MKNPLLVLLPIAVTFFFILGTAFAAQVDKSPIANAQSAGYTAIEKAAEALLDNFKFDDDGNLTAYYVGTTNTALTEGGTSFSLSTIAISKATVQAVIAEAVTAAKAAVQDVATGAYNTAASDADVTNGVTAVQQEVQTQTTGLATAVVNSGDAVKLLKKEAETAKETAQTELNGYTTSQYSDSIKDWSIKPTDTFGQDGTAFAGYSASTISGITAESSAKAFVEGVIKTQLAAVDATDGMSKYVYKIDGCTKARTIAKNVITGHKKTASENYYIAPVPTAEELNADTSVDAAKTYALKQLRAELAVRAAEEQKTLNDALAAENKNAKPDEDVIKALNKALNELDANYAAVEEVWSATINAQKTVDAVNTVWGTNIKTALPNVKYDAAPTYKDTVFQPFVQRCKDVKALEEYAKLVESYVDREGNTAFDKAAIADALVEATEEIYLGNKTLTQAKGMIDSAANISDALIAQKSKYVGNIDGEGAALTIDGKSYATWNPATDYEAAQLEAYNACVDSTTQAILAATSYDAIVNAYLDGYKTYDAIITKTEHTTDWATGGKLNAEYTKNYKADLDAYVAYVTAKLGTKYSNATGDTNLATKVMDIVKKAYTKEEISAQVAAAKAYLDGLKSDDELAAEKKKVEALVAALPTKITLAEKEQVLAAKVANEDYMDLAGATAIGNNVSLANSIKTLAALEKNEIQDKIDAIKKAGVTVDSAAAIQEVVDAIKAYEKNYKAEIQANTVDGLTAEKADRDQLKKDLSEAQVNAVIKLCANVSLTPNTAAEAEAIKAARAAFEALDIHQQASMLNTYAYDKLSQAEKVLIESVEALKITASSTAKKGSITVKWTVEGYASSAQAYEIWKSTKKNSGFKKAFTTKDGTKRSYKNTKGLKKGTRYYYKVRAIAYDANGTKIKSDWSNKAYRKAK